MISFYTITTILICHFIFDFFFQSDRMAKGKSKDMECLVDHVGVYYIGIFLIACFNFNSFENPSMFMSFVFINVIAHFFTDYYSSRASSRLYADNEFHDFFGTIGLDQLVHYVTLFGTFVWLTK